MGVKSSSLAGWTLLIIKALVSQFVVGKYQMSGMVIFQWLLFNDINTLN